MRGYRDGKKVVYCDGCFGVIENFKPRIHNSTKDAAGNMRHVCSIGCAKKAKATKPPQTFCSTAGCDVRLATGEPACLNKHPQ